MLVTSYRISGPGGRQRRVIHQNVQRAKTLDNVGEHGDPLAARGDVAVQGQTVGTRRFNGLAGFLQGGDIDIADDNIRTGPREMPGNGSPQASARAGNQYDTACKVARASLRHFKWRVFKLLVQLHK